MSRVTLRLAALAGLGLAACSIDHTAFHATPDAGGTGDDAATGVLAIRPSVSSLDVDEGGTKDFTVQLTQAPSAELVVRVVPADAASATRIGISLPELRFEPTSFDQPQTLTVTGLADVDTVDGLAGIKLTADGVDPVTVNATVLDHDKVEIATDMGASGVLTVNETRTAAVRVHLTHQPSADVRVTVMLGAGPVTVSPASATFTAANYNVDQTFTFTAPDDVNVISEDESLTFQAAGSADRLYTIHDVDKDSLNINATPTTLSVNEGGSSSVSVTLTKQPPADTTVNVALQLGNVTVDHTNLTFTPQNFNVAQVIKVSAPQDANTVNESDQITLSAAGVSSVTLSASTVDDDVQAILENAPDPLSVTENQTATFGVTLKFQPSSTVTVTVSALDSSVATASPGTLTFTPQNYNDPAVHQVTVRGTDDNNLAANSTSIKLHEPTLVDVLARVAVADDDTQTIMVSKTSLAVPEGMSGTFDVSLKFDPGATVTTSITSTNPTSLPVSPASIAFTGGPSGNWATPVHVTVSPPVDTNNLAETATITVSGGGAPVPVTVMASVTDSTVVTQFGFPTPFPGTSSVLLGQVIAYRITVDTTTTLDSFGVYIPVGTGDFRMALYADGLNAPGALVAQMPVRQAIVSGSNTGNIADLNLPLGTYWIALRVAQTTAVGFSTVGTGPVCVRNTDIPNLDDLWPSSFGGATCGSDHFMNFFINTYHQ